MPSSLAATPDSNAPSSFDEPTKIEFTDDTRPSRCDGVSTCSSVDRTSTLTLSAMPLIASSADRKHEAARQSERDDAQRERRDRIEQRASGALERRTMREIHRRDHRAGRRRRAQDPESLRTDVKNLIGKHGQQRLGAAEQHREQIERQRREQDRFAKHESQARDADSSPIDSFVDDRRRVRAYSIHQNVERARSPS